MKSVCVFCGSNVGRRRAYAEAARAVGATLAARGLGLVYGGGRVGLMGIVADTVLAAGGRAVGVIPRALVAREVGHAGLTELHVVETMHERKARMADLADAFVALPGGFGTLEEFCEVITWSQLGIHPKPCGLLNVEGYYDPLLALFDRAVEEGFLPPMHRAIVIDDTEPGRLLERLEAFRPPDTRKWIGLEER
ncbi:MAG TPA: TIGR00730 family Rossman fold protein [Longimicrobiaceae bacterium]|nr:TIGR00730 family Rossman fold protein [Longimicrobiaceae bacterium]